MNKNDLQEFFYLLMSSWIFSIEKTRDELLRDNITNTLRIHWNTNYFVMGHLENSCGISLDTEGKSTMDLILANFLENLTPEQYSYKLDADPEVQPGESFTSYLGDLS